MALKKSINIEAISQFKTDFGIIENGNETLSSDCYIKISSITATKDSIIATVQYVSDKFNFQKVFNLPASVNEGSVNFIKQAYEQLKLLPEFSGATDC
jgi:hypothetical protein